MDAAFYSSQTWRDLRERVRARDGDRCTVQRLLGGDCSGRLHVHHIDPSDDPLNPDNCSTVCARHHPKWEALRRSLVRGKPTTYRRCPHRHRYDHARRECERRLNAGV